MKKAAQAAFFINRIGLCWMYSRIEPLTSAPVHYPESAVYAHDSKTTDAHV